MYGFLWLAAILCGLAYLFKRPFFADPLVQTPAQRQHQFIVDVCDGNRGQAQRLLEEKSCQHPGLQDWQVRQMVYEDMLAFTVEERLAAQKPSRNRLDKVTVTESAA